MATKRDIIDDIRSIWPGTGVLSKADVLRYLKDHAKTSAEANEFICSLEPVKINKSTKYFVVDIADKLYRRQSGTGA
ncbi:hypothetical protein [Intestinibacillus massiliensis]